MRRPRALEFGIGACSVVRCGHAGRAGAWVERAVGRGAVGIVLLGGADPPFVMAAGPGTVASLHTNPIAIGVPAEGPPFILDMATSLVAEGKVAIAALARDALPEGAIVDRERDHRGGAGGVLRRRGTAPGRRSQGFGLAAMVEALSVSLTGAAARSAGRGRARDLHRAAASAPKRSASIDRGIRAVSTRQAGSALSSPPASLRRVRAPRRRSRSRAPCSSACAALRRLAADARLSGAHHRGQSVGLAGIRAPRIRRAKRRWVCRYARTGQRDRCTGDDVELSGDRSSRHPLGPTRRGRNRDVAPCRLMTSGRRLDRCKRRLRETDGGHISP